MLYGFTSDELSRLRSWSTALLCPESSARVFISARFGSPPSAVLMVTGAVMVLVLGQHGRVPKDRSWPKVKAMMGKVDQFLDSLGKVKHSGHFWK